MENVSNKRNNSNMYEYDLFNKNGTIGRKPYENGYIILRYWFPVAKC